MSGWAKQMEERLEDLLLAVENDLQERLERLDRFTDQEYLQGLIDGIYLSIGIIDKYKKGA